MRLKFDEILPNPYRDLKANPLKKEKISELISSIDTTGFWDNVLVRKNKDGKYELAYGHHRIAAAKEAGLKDADFIVKDLDDTRMIQIMDNENREAYASTPASLIESVKAVVSALAEGLIPPFKLAPDVRKDAVRYAPSFVPGEPPEANLASRAYTALSIAKFLGRTKSMGQNRGEKPEVAVVAALDALHLQELGHKVPLTTKNRVGEIKPISVSELQKITSEIKEGVEKVRAREGKTAEEIAKLREEQLKEQQRLKAEEEKKEAESKALLLRAAKAREAENLAKAEELAQKAKAKIEQARNTEARAKQAMKELAEKIEAKKKWEAEQRVQDAYMTIRRDVEVMMNKLERIASEGNPFREEVKALAKLKALKPEDRRRLRKAAAAAGNWYLDWVAPQFAPLPTGSAELKAMTKKEVAKRKAEAAEKEAKELKAKKEKK